MTTLTIDDVWAAVPEDVELGHQIGAVEGELAKLAADPPAPAPTPGQTAQAIRAGDTAEVLERLPVDLAGGVRAELWERHQRHLAEVRGALTGERQAIRGTIHGCDAASEVLRAWHAELMAETRHAAKILRGVDTAEAAIAAGSDAVTAWQQLTNAAADLATLRAIQANVLAGSQTLRNRWDVSVAQVLNQTGLARVPEPWKSEVRNVDVVDTTPPLQPWHAGPVPAALWESRSRAWVPTIGGLLQAFMARTNARTAARGEAESGTPSKPIRAASDRDLRWAGREAEYAAFHAN